MLNKITILGNNLYLSALFLCIINAPAYATDGDLNFVENRSQWPASVHYRADVPGGAMFLTGTGFTYSLYSREDVARIHELGHQKPGVNLDSEPIRGHAYRVLFAGSRPDVQLSSSGKRDHYCNYFLGSDPQHWAGGIPVWEHVSYTGLYTGIDLEVYSVGASAKYDFIVAAGADPASIALQFEGVNPALTPEGDLKIETSVGTILEKAPVAYQSIAGARREVPCRYVFAADGRISFAFPAGYDRKAALVIDPVLVFSTYSGSGAETYGYSATYDAAGSLYSGGLCFNTGWPVTAGAFQVTFGGGATDASINKYSPNGATLIYSTYYGGSSGEGPSNMVVNAAGELIVVGRTGSGNLPVTPGCYDNTLGGLGDFFVAHFNAAGTALIGSTYVGGNGDDASPSSTLSPNYGDQARGEVIVDASGDIIVAGVTSSTDFPATTGAFQTAIGGAQDGCVFRLNGACTALSWATFLGGSSNDACFALERMSTGGFAVTGATTSANFPTTAGALQTTNPGGTDAFVAVLSGTGSTLTASTYLGTADFDHGYKIQVAPGDSIYVLGQTDGGAGFPVSPAAYTNPGGNLFIAVLSPNLAAMTRSTIIGAANEAVIPSAFLYDVCGNVYVCGYNNSFGLNNMPLTANAHQSTPGGFWLCVLRGGMSMLDYGTYMGDPGDHIDGGSSRFDPQGIVYHSVCTSSPGAWSMPGAYSPVKGTQFYDVASFKFNFEAIGVVANISLGSSNDTGCRPYTIPFINLSTPTATCTWDFGDGSPLYTGYTPPAHTYNTPGTYTVKLYAAVTATTGCQGADTATAAITVIDTAAVAVAGVVQDTVCQPDIVQFINNSVGGTAYQWDFGDGSTPSNAYAPTHIYAAPGVYNARLITSSTVLCASTDTDYVAVTVNAFGVTASIGINANDSGCAPYNVPFTNFTTGAASYTWDFGDGSFSTAATPTHTFTTPGTFVVKLVAHNTDPYACFPADSVYETIHVLVLDAPQLTLTDTLVCEPGTILLRAAVANPASTMSYQWSPATAIIGSVTTQNVWVDATTPNSFSVTITNQLNSMCATTASASMNLTIWQKPLAGGDTLICPHNAAQLRAVGGDGAIRWSPAYYLSADTGRSPLASPPAPMTYRLISSFKHCKDSTEHVQVAVAPSGLIALPDSVRIYPGENYRMDPGGNCLYFSWFPPLGLSFAGIANPLASPPVNTRYFVTGTTEMGCPATDSIDVLVSLESLLDVPNAFTPGGGSGSPNNKLMIVRRGDARLRHFRIFNRWGQVVFETADINEGWDGAFKGVPQPMGVFVYTVEALTPGGRVWSKQGNVTLIR